MSTILVVDDEVDIRESVAATFQGRGYHILTAGDGIDALEQLKAHPVQLVITDLRMPRADGFEVITKGRAISPGTQFIVMTAFATIETAIEALRSGAADYISKPIAHEELLSRVGRVLEAMKLKQTNKMLRRDLERKVGSLEVTGQSPAIARIREMIAKVAPTRSPVLITGESGTGKELVARSIHSLSGVADEPFVLLHCTAIPEALLEAELFGAQNGTHKEGLLLAARKGTLFLDEIAVLPPPVQAKLLRALEEKAIEHTGTSTTVPFEARLIAATQRSLQDEISKGALREDLYYRLAVVELHVPPLRERPQDIPLLVQYFLDRVNADLGRHYAGVEESAMKTLVQARWKGNIRELQNVVERAAILGSEPLIREADLITSASTAMFSVADSTQLKDAVRSFEQTHVRRILKRCNGDKRKAAKELGISLSSLYRYLGDTVSAVVGQEPAGVSQ